MQSNYLVETLNLSKRKILIYLVISGFFALAAGGYSLYRSKNSIEFEIEAKLPLTSHGELATLYARSPFKELRVAFPPDIYFSEASFLVTTDKSDNAERVKTKLLDLLNSYYQNREPIRLKYSNPKKGDLELKLQHHRTKAALHQEAFQTLKQRFSHFSARSFEKLEETILSLEAEIIIMQKQLQEIEDQKIKEVSVKEPVVKNIKLMSLNLILKVFLIFSCLFFVVGLVDQIIFSSKGKT